MKCPPFLISSEYFFFLVGCYFLYFRVFTGLEVGQGGRSSDQLSVSRTDHDPHGPPLSGKSLRQVFFIGCRRVPNRPHRPNRETFGDHPGAAIEIVNQLGSFPRDLKIRKENQSRKENSE